MGRRRKERITQTKRARFGVYLDARTRQALLMAALAENTSATELVERLITTYLRARRKGRTGTA